MSDDKNISKPKESQYEAINVEWEIIDFFRKRKKSYTNISPTFSFAKYKWRLYLWRVGSEYIWLQLVTESSNNEPRRNWKCKFGLKKRDGDSLYFPKLSISFLTSIPTEIFLDNRTFSSSMTILCTVQRIRHFSELFASREYVPLRLIKFDLLSLNIKRFFTDNDSHDVIIQVKEKVLNAHKFVLMARSSVFTTMFHHDMLEKQTGIVTISDCDPDAFQKFLEYLYSGQVNDATFHNIFHLYRISDKYDVQEIKPFCTEYMRKCFTEDNICDIVILADMYNEAKLFSAAQAFFKKNSHKIVETADWENLMKTNFPLANRLIKVTKSKLKREFITSYV